MARIFQIGRLISSFVIFALCGCNRLFYHPSNQITYAPDQFRMVYDGVTISVGDSVNLRAWRIKPSTSGLENAPQMPIAVLQFHGNAENRSTHFLSVAWLAAEGVDVVVFDYRGYGGSSGSPSRAGLIKDGVAVLKWFEQQYPKHRRFVIAQSLGGAVATTSLVKSGVSISGLVVESTFHSYQGVAQMKMASSWMLWCFQWLPYLLVSADEDPVDFASNVFVPVLAFHDLRDPVVPYKSGKILYDRFPPSLVHLITHEGADHAAALGTSRPDGKDELRRFIGIK